MRVVSFDYIVNLTEKYLGIQIPVIDQKYIEYKTTEGTCIATIPDTHSSESLLNFINESKFYDFSSIIIKIKNNNLIIFPSFLECLSKDVHQIELDMLEAREFTFGHKMKLQCFNSLILVVDNFGRKISLGQCNSNLFTPIIDIGWYLREE